MIPDLELSAQAATLISALIGGIIGSVGTYYGQSRLRRKRESKSEEWLRHALLAELESMEALDNWPIEPPSGAVPSGNWLNNQVFESVSTEVGKLDSDELHALILFHGQANHVRSDIKSLPSSEETWPESQVNAIQDHLKAVKRNRRAAMHILSTNINKRR